MPERKFPGKIKTTERVENAISRRTVEYLTDFEVFDIVIKSKLCRMLNVTSQTKSFTLEIKDAKFSFDFQILRLSNYFLVN